LARPKQKENQRLGDIVSGVFTPVLAKHSKSFSLVDAIAVGVDRMQRNFEPMREQVEAFSAPSNSQQEIRVQPVFIEGRSTNRV